MLHESALWDKLPEKMHRVTGEMLNKTVEYSLKNRGTVLVQFNLTLSYVIEQLNEHFENLIAHSFPEIITITNFFSNFLVE